MAENTAGIATGGMNSHTGTLSATNTMNNNISILVPSRWIFTLWILTVFYIEADNMSRDVSSSSARTDNRMDRCYLA